MKKLIVLLTLLLFTVVSFAQTTPFQEEKKIVVNASDLTPEQLKKIEDKAQLDAVEKKLETYGKWVGVGSEIGIAIRDGLNAVVDVSDKFGKTNVGKFTMIMIAYKIIGQDLIRIFIGLLFITIFTIFMFKHYRKNFTTYRVCIKDNGWKIWLPKEYEVVKPEDYDGYEFMKWLNIVMLLGGFGITYAIMFA